MTIWHRSDEGKEYEVRRGFRESDSFWMTSIKDDIANVYKLSRKGNLYIFERLIQETDALEFVTSATSIDLLVEHIIGEYI